MLLPVTQVLHAASGTTNHPSDRPSASARLPHWVRGRDQHRLAPRPYVSHCQLAGAATVSFLSLDRGSALSSSTSHRSRRRPAALQGRGRDGRLELLLVDELGYVSVDPRGGELLFQV